MAESQSALLLALALPPAPVTRRATPTRRCDRPPPALSSPPMPSAERVSSSLPPTRPRERRRTRAVVLLFAISDAAAAAAASAFAGPSLPCPALGPAPAAPAEWVSAPLPELLEVSDHGRDPPPLLPRPGSGRLSVICTALPLAGGARGGSPESPISSTSEGSEAMMDCTAADSGQASATSRSAFAIRCSVCFISLFSDFNSRTSSSCCRRHSSSQREVWHKNREERVVLTGSSCTDGLLTMFRARIA